MNRAGWLEFGLAMKLPPGKKCSSFFSFDIHPLNFTRGVTFGWYNTSAPCKCNFDITDPSIKRYI